MPNVQRIQHKIDRGMGKAARAYGQQFSVYRLLPTLSGVGIVQPQALIATVSAYFERYEKKADLEIVSAAKVDFYRADVDLTPFAVGDVFVEVPTQFRGDRSVFTLIYMRPMHEPLFVATPVFATLSHPDANPSRIRVGRAPYSGEAKEYEWPLVLQNGAYSFVQTLGNGQVPATVPVALSLSPRIGREVPMDVRLPDDVPQQQVDAFVPSLPGLQLVENDTITGSDGDRYRIIKPYARAVGAVGQFLITQKKRV